MTWYYNRILLALCAWLRGCTSPELMRLDSIACAPQIGHGGGRVEIRTANEPSERVSKAEVLETSSEALGRLAVERALRSIYPRSNEPREQTHIENFHGIGPDDRVVLARPLSRPDAMTTPTSRLRPRTDTSSGRVESTKQKSKSSAVLCGESVEERFGVHGYLRHSSCDSGLAVGRQLFLIWTRPTEQGWVVQDAHPAYPVSPADYAITGWAARMLLLDPIEREIPELADLAAPYFDVAGHANLARLDLDLYRESPHYTVRGTAVHPRSGVLVSEAAAALQVPCFE